ncbi:organic cation transporter protein-like [Tubulanus polymorphus]|uniref:organic cation transporter protein-like n=1 Tax=Tubulanus polymorphus TaxID=672921 RepID=UPI003DA5200C
MINIEAKLQEIGGYGRYQMLVFLCICFVCMRGAWHPFVSSFTALTPDLLCTNLTYDTNISASFPTANVSVKLGTFHVSSENVDEYLCGTRVNSTSCQFDVLKHGKTYVSEWNLVCGKSYLVSLNTAVFMIGQMVGAIFLSMCADIIGRKKMLIVYLLSQAAVGLGAAFVDGYIFFTVLRFIIGALNQGIALVGYVTVCELFPATHRTMPCVGIQFFWALGVMALSGIAYWLKDWNYIQIAISVPSFLAIIYIWIIPESVIWLSFKGRIADAQKILGKFAKWNGKALSQDCEDCDCSNDRINTDDVNAQKDCTSCSSQVVVEDEENSSRISALGKCSVFGIFKRPRMAMYSIVMFYSWLANSMLYFGISFSFTLLPGNIYLNFFLNGLAEIPAYLTGMYALGHGRRIALFTFLMIGGIANIIIVLVATYASSTVTWLTPVMITLAMVGKFGITGSYSTTYLYAAEMFPTFIRNSSVGLSSLWETLGAVMAPFVLEWAGGSQIFRVLFGLIAITAALLSLCLPETKNQPLPETIDDVEKMPRLDFRRYFKCCFAVPAPVVVNRRPVTVDDCDSPTYNSTELECIDLKT